MSGTTHRSIVLDALNNETTPGVLFSIEAVSAVDVSRFVHDRLDAASMDEFLLLPCIQLQVRRDDDDDDGCDDDDDDASCKDAKDSVGSSKISGISRTFVVTSAELTTRADDDDDDAMGTSVLVTSPQSEMCCENFR